MTFFFNGGREEVFEKEVRIMVPSPKVATYDLKPEMNSAGVGDEVRASFPIVFYTPLSLHWL